MMRPAARLVLLCMGLAPLHACQPQTDAPQPAPAASAAAPAASSTPVGAVDDAPASLMAQAFEGWTSKVPYSTPVPADEAGAGEAVDVLVSPTLVVALDADHRVLVVSGPPTDADGRPQEHHITEANVGLYGFERRDGRWFKSFERPSLTWTGFNGSAGSIKAQTLGPGRAALSIENGSCWQGTCGEWLKLYALDTSGPKALASLMSGSSSTGATMGCEEWLKGKPLGAGDEAMPITADNCFDISSQWRFEKAGKSGWPDLVLKFSGAEAAPGGKPDQLVPRAIDARLVLRHDGSAYRILSGRNPTHDI